MITQFRASTLERDALKVDIIMGGGTVRLIKLIQDKDYLNYHLDKEDFLNY